MQISADGVGHMTIDFGTTQESVKDILVLSDGKLLFFGNTREGAALVRLLPSGIPDTSFAAQGMLSTSLVSAYDMVVQADGKILLIGDIGPYSHITGYDVAIQRFTAQGAIDTSYGDMGTLRLGSGDSAWAGPSAALRADGSLLVGTTGRANPEAPGDYYVHRVLENGQLDLSFGTNGQVVVDSGYDDALSRVVLQSDGKIVLVGTSLTAMSESDFFVSRLLSTGQLDSSFGNGGKKTLDIGDGDNAADVVVGPDGKILIGGTSQGLYAVARLTASGAPDSTFHATGSVTTGMVMNQNGERVLLQQDGKIILAGNLSSWGEFGAVRFNPDGTIDETFGSHGYVNFYFTTYIDTLATAAITPAGQILLAGNSYSGDWAIGTFDSSGRPVSFGKDTVAPRVMEITPSPHQTQVPPSLPITIRLSEPARLGGGAIALFTTGGHEVETFSAFDTSVFSLSGESLTLYPRDGLEANTSYTLLFSEDSLTDLAGNPVALTSSYDFTTGSALSIGGSSGDDSIRARGAASIDGAEGTDRVEFGRNLGAYRISLDGAGHKVQGETVGSPTFNLANVERLVFNDFTVNLSIAHTVGLVTEPSASRLVELYVAFFNRIPDAEGLEFWIKTLAAGKSMNDIANAFFLAGSNYSALTGYSADMANEAFVRLIYKNVLGRTDGGDPEGVAFWTLQLDSQGRQKGDVVNVLLDSAHTFKGDATWGWVADLLDNKVFVARTLAIDCGLGYVDSTDAVSQGMQVAAAVTPTDTNSALALVGVSFGDIDLG